MSDETDEGKISFVNDQTTEDVALKAGLLDRLVC